MDPDADPDPAIFIIVLQEANKKKFGFYFSIYLSLGHHKERPSYRRSLQPSAENIQPFKTEKNRMRIRIRIWIQIRKSVVRYEYPYLYQNVTDPQYWP